MGWAGHLPPQIHIESYSSVNLCPVFYMKAYLHRTEPFREKSDGSWVSSLFIGYNRHHMPVCAKMISFGVMKFLCISIGHISLGAVQSFAASGALVAGVFMVSIL